MKSQSAFLLLPAVLLSAGLLCSCSSLPDGEPFLVIIRVLDSNSGAIAGAECTLGEDLEGIHILNNNSDHFGRIYLTIPFDQGTENLNLEISHPGYLPSSVSISLRDIESLKIAPVLLRSAEDLLQEILQMCSLGDFSTSKAMIDHLPEALRENPRLQYLKALVMYRLGEAVAARSLLETLDASDTAVQKLDSLIRQNQEVNND